jgi:hypothetical protein
MARVVAMSTGTFALVGILLLGAGGHLRLETLQELAGGADYINGGVRIVPPSAIAPGAGEEPDDQPGGMPEKLEVEGDQVNPALATYGIDRDGNLFEVHSPQTEVARLPGPTT